MAADTVGPTATSAPAPAHVRTKHTPVAAGSVSVDYRSLGIQWVNMIFFSFTTLASLYSLWMVPFRWPTFIFGFLLYIWGGISITAGYHRCWSHRAYEASTPLRLALAVGGAAAFQGSVLWWSRHHRAHHRWTDTQYDPYGAHKGLFWSHIGWLLFHEPDEKKSRPRVYDDDLVQDWVVMWQHRNFSWLAPVVAILMPTLVAGLGWGDWQGGYFHAAILRMSTTHHVTFSVNSLAHYLGHTIYDDDQTPRDHFITALLTLGEGYHNFHHTFPRDYRNAIRWWQYDPTKWIIWLCSKVGLARALHRFPENEVLKARVIMKLKQLEEEKQRVDWGPQDEDLPRYTFDAFRRECEENGRWWTIIDGSIFDLEGFAKDHPGGIVYMRSARGRDVSEAFNGGVHLHRGAAQRMLQSLRVALLEV